MNILKKDKLKSKNLQKNKKKKEVKLIQMKY